MAQVATGVTFRETMAGGFMLGASDPVQGLAAGTASGTVLTMHATITVSDLAAFVTDPQHAGGLVGTIDYPPFGNAIDAPRGVFKLFAPSGQQGLTYMVYELGFRHAGKDYYLAGKKHVQAGPPWKGWKETTTLYTTLHEGMDASGRTVGAGVLSLGVVELLKLLSTFHATNATFLQSLGATIRFSAFFTVQLWNTYIVQR